MCGKFLITILIKMANAVRLNFLCKRDNSWYIRCLHCTFSDRCAFYVSVVFTKTGHFTKTRRLAGHVQQNDV